MKDINSIKQYLVSIQLPNKGYVPIYVGNFLIFISPPRSEGYSQFSEGDSLSRYEILDISLYEKYRTEDGEDSLIYVGLECDSRFTNFDLIKYSKYKGLSDGRGIPLKSLCELIKYLYRLTDLVAFQ